jgi:hypothetical protein
MDERYLTSFEDQTTALGYTSGDTTLVSPQVSLVGADEVVYSKEIPHEKKIRFAKDETTGKLYFVVDGVLYEGIDLGLPSGTIWADKNVGAETPQDNGLYFSWGNVDGHAVENGNVADGYLFVGATYSTTLGGQFTGSTLDAEHDAATANMGDGWRMPTSAETVELVQNTVHYYIGKDGNIVAGPFNYGTNWSDKGLDGSKLRSICFVKKGEEFDYDVRGNFIELPFAGYCRGSLLGNEGLYVCVWSSSVNESSVEDARYLYFNSDGELGGDCNFYRYLGLSVRGVRA